MGSKALPQTEVEQAFIVSPPAYGIDESNQNSPIHRVRGHNLNPQSIQNPNKAIPTRTAPKPCYRESTKLV